MNVHSVPSLMSPVSGMIGASGRVRLAAGWNWWWAMAWGQVVQGAGAMAAMMGSGRRRYRRRWRRGSVSGLPRRAIVVPVRAGPDPGLRFGGLEPAWRHEHWPLAPGRAAH